MTRDEWDIFYPLAHWDVITREARARSLDPYTVAGLIRQESVFNPRAASSANAYGLMQLLIPTARATGESGANVALGIAAPLRFNTSSRSRERCPYQLAS